jgi:hypothetical protein
MHFIRLGQTVSVTSGTAPKLTVRVHLGETCIGLSSCTKHPLMHGLLA